MYKLFVNNVQIGNYGNLRTLASAAARASARGEGVRSTEWRNNSLFVFLFD